MSTSTETQSFPVADVREALNRAADDVIDTEIENEDDRDRVNLLVNVALSYLTGEAETVADAVTANYGGEAHIDAQGVLVWRPDEDEGE